MSGKAMQDAVTKIKTALRELTRSVEASEGHGRVCGLFVAYYRSTCRTKMGKFGDANQAIR
jgi:hypothetical protein